MTDEKTRQLAINTIRTLSIDAVQQAKSGHPGTPMARADMPARRVAPAVLRYGLSVVSVAIALSATLLLEGYTFRTPLFFPAIMLSTWFGGTGPGLLAVLLPTLSVNYFFPGPTLQLEFGLHDIPHLVTFLLSAVLVSSWSAARRRAEDALRRARDELEAKVQERTAALSRSNEQLRIEITEGERTHAERAQLLTREQAARVEAVAAQHRFRDLVNSIEGIVWEADAQTLQFLFVSQQAQRVLGYPVERWLNEPTFWQEHLHADDREWAVELCMAATAEKKAHDFEYRMIAADGRSVWLRDIVTVVVEGHRATTLRGVMFDITARKRAEEVLREQASLLNLTHDTIFVRDITDVITYWNRGAEELYGWESAAAVGKVTHELMQTIFPAPLAEINEELLRAGRWEGELIHTKRDRTQVVVASRWALQRDAQGRPSAILETNNDITERKRAKEALHRAQAELAHVTRVMTMGELATSIAHEVNQSLAGIITNGNTCLRRLAREPLNLDEVREGLRRIIRDGNRASEVIARIRALVKKSALTKARLDLSEAIHEVLAMTNTEAVRHRVAVRTELAAGLPPVQGDRVQVQQVLLNLVMNGIDAMRAVTERPRALLIRAQPYESDTVLVAVQDSGIGLDLQRLDRLFEAFYTTKPEGLGMGLAISRSIIEAHGGRLWATPNDRHGATFQFTLPTEGNSPYDRS